MSKRLTLLALPVCMLLFSACNKNDHNGQPPTTMYYRQTQCADVWGTGATNEETVTKVESYFAGKGLPIASVRIAADSVADACEACTCRTANTIYAQISEAYIGEYKSYGFRQ